MKRVVVRVSDNYSLDSAAAAILKLYGYLTFVKSYRSFGIISFDCPDTYQNVILEYQILILILEAQIQLLGEIILTLLEEILQIVL